MEPDRTIDTAAPRPTAAVASMAVAAACLAAGAAPGAEWTMFRGDPALTGVAGEELALPLAPVWAFDAGQDGVESTAAIAGGTVYVGSLDGNLYALDLATGEERWRYSTGEEIKSSPAVREGTVYFGDEHGDFHAVGAASGEARWTFETDGAVTSSATFATGDDGRTLVVFGSYDGFLYALRAADGSLAWKVETENYVHATPAVAGGKAYFGGCDGYFRAVELATGTEAGKVQLQAYVAASAAIEGGRAYVGTFENEVLALDLNEGGAAADAAPELAWRFNDPESRFPFYASAAVTPELVVVGGRDKQVRGLDPGTGKARWSFATPARVDASPVIAGGVAFAAAKSGDLYALSLDSGEPRWQYATGSPITASPAVGGGRLVIGTLDGTVFAFGAADKEGSAP